MLLFLKGFIIGIGKIIPGVSGALLAINFHVYERLINAITHFFDGKKENFKFLLIIYIFVLVILNYSGTGLWKKMAKAIKEK